LLLYSSYLPLGVPNWTVIYIITTTQSNDDEEENDDDNYRSMFPEYDDTAMEDNEEEGQGEERAPDEPADDLGRVISDARRGCDTEKERLQFEQMLQDHDTSQTYL
jgi:hypothetical protein